MPVHPEQQYLDLIRHILDDGFFRPSPHAPINGVPNPGTFSVINANLTFDLSEGYFPLMTVRQMGLKTVADELAWFLSGSTKNPELQALGTHIWDAWDSPETNQSMGWEPGQLGPIYGKQWRHWGARMAKPDGAFDQPGLDQISQLLTGIRTTPNSKRLGVMSYDPLDMPDCFVTTCHGEFWVQVRDDRLCLHMIQRSGDVPVGIPFNIASYALLAMLLAQVSGLKPGLLNLTISHAHVYENQVEAMRELLKRVPLPYSSVEIDPALKDIFAFRATHARLVGYRHHGKLLVPVAT